MRTRNDTHFVVYYRDSPKQTSLLILISNIPTNIWEESKVLEWYAESMRLTSLS